jgi:hypothetical protein
MDKGAVLNTREGNGVPSLLRAALIAGMDRIAKLLMEENEVDFGGVSGLGDTYLHSIAQSGRTAFVDVLIGKGLDPKARNAYGWAPLHYAAYGGHRDMVDVLLKSGADKNARTKDGRTPYNLADEFGRKELLPHLKEKGFDVAPPEFPKIDAPYIDPDLPGPEPKRFALGIVSQLPHFEHGIFSFAEDMNSACWVDWQRDGISKIFVMEKKDGLWQAPLAVQLGAASPYLAPDGRRIYFTAPRMLPDGKAAPDNDIYYIEKTKSGWGPKVNLGPNVNTAADEIQPTVARDGTVYFSHQADIYRAQPVAGGYGPKEKLPAPINSDYNQVQPNISSDERFLIFRSLGPRGFREPSSFISARNAAGAWSEPVAIDKKFAKIGLFGNLTPDRKYWICFENGDLFWLDVSAAMEELLSSPKK